jgi:N-acetylglutamate synthase-like GNAT family acetyltransferase
MNIEQGNTFVQAFQALPLMRSLDTLYPGFEYWYVNTVVPGVVLGRDQLVLAKEQGRVVGVALGKRSEDETKLRCVRVLPEFEHKGVGIRLMTACWTSSSARSLIARSRKRCCTHTAARSCSATASR